MKTRITEERLALLAALVVLVGVSSAAGDAFAQEGPAAVTATAVAVHAAPDATRTIAAEANAESAARAARSLARQNWVDLEFRLEDRRSGSIAGQR